MKLKLVELLTTLKTVYVSHLAASIAVTAIAGTVAVGGISYGVYTASRPTPVEEVVVAEEVSSTNAKESTTADTKPTKNETASSEKVESAKKDSETSAPKKEEKISSKTEAKTETKTEKKGNASPSESQPSPQATQTKAAESKSTTSNQSASSQNESKPDTSASSAPAPSKSDSNKQKEDAPKAHVHSWRHVDAVTKPIYETRYVVDQAAYDEPRTISYEVTDYNETEIVQNGIVCPPHSVVVGSHTVTEVDITHHEEQGHYEQVQVGTEVVTPAYDVCSECGAKK